jgi:iron complex outermembrane receptor protein
MRSWQIPASIQIHAYVLLLCGMLCPGIQASGAPDALLSELPVVEAAALHAQSLEEVPANVTVISAREIRRYGYRTLADVLAAVRGFYVTYDHAYHYVGVRGLSPAGDYNTRFLVMLNGHPLTEIVFNSNAYFGQDFGIDMDLVSRIEIIRGPSSALYGSNGILANINVVTRSPAEAERAAASVETGSFGERKALLSTAAHLGRGANLLVAGAVFHNGGRALTLDERGQSPAVADTERGYHSFANLVWRRWNITGMFSAREKQVPIGWGGSVFGTAGNRVFDSRNLLGASYTRDTITGGHIRWQLYFDEYRYDDRFDYVSDEDAVEDVRSPASGSWVDSQLTYSIDAAQTGYLTAGLQAAYELRNLQETLVAAPEPRSLLWINRPDRSFAVFLQDELRLARAWTAYLGLRLDDSANFNRFVSPRAALVYQRSAGNSYKFVYGRPFRNPSAYEQYYHDEGLSIAPSPKLNPETAHAFEVSAERRIGRRSQGIVNAYHYRLDRLIQAVALDNSVQQYQNGSAVRSTGIELEFSGKLPRESEALASVALQRPSSGVPNSPRIIGKGRLGAPAFQDRVFLSSHWQYLSSRLTWSGARVGVAVTLDVTATVKLNGDFDLQFGARNALNRFYEDPIYLVVDRVPRGRRAAWLKLVWRPCE